MWFADCSQGCRLVVHEKDRVVVSTFVSSAYIFIFSSREDNIVDECVGHWLGEHAVLPFVPVIRSLACETVVCARALSREDDLVYEIDHSSLTEFPYGLFVSPLAPMRDYRSVGSRRASFLDMLKEVRHVSQPISTRVEDIVVVQIKVQVCPERVCHGSIKKL